MDISNLADRIRELIDDTSHERLAEELDSYHEADLADLFNYLKLNGVDFDV